MSCTTCVTDNDNYRLRLATVPWTVLLQNFWLLGTIIPMELLPPAAFVSKQGNCQRNFILKCSRKVIIKNPRQAIATCRCSLASVVFKENKTLVWHHTMPVFRRPCSDSRHVTAPYKLALYYYYYYTTPCGLSVVCSWSSSESILFSGTMAV